MKGILSSVAILVFTLACDQATHQTPDDSHQAFDMNSKPYTRYWWFASEIEKEDVKYNLDWLKSHGFGGVELAWVYPLNRFSPEDTTYTLRQEWLSPEWQSIVEYTIKYADSIGLGCDLTLATLWPFGDSYVKFIGDVLKVLVYSLFGLWGGVPPNSLQMCLL